MSELSHAVIGHLERHASRPFAFWTQHDQSTDIPLQDACDVLYSLKLAGCTDLLADDAGQRFALLLNRHRLAGGIGPGDGPDLNVHLTAYALGVLNLLKAEGMPSHQAALRQTGWNIDELVHPETSLPRWPVLLSHHSWRASHWIGGVPSILKSLWALAPDLAERNDIPSVEFILSRGDTLIDARTGLLRVYKLEFLQKLFRVLYRYRHDPVAADIGGVAHLHWLNYVSGRLPYKSAPALMESARKVLQRRPFLERVPYCLDFDVVQVMRTSLQARGDVDEAFRDRARAYFDDIHNFYIRDMDGDYALHCLPGGLATLHECALAMDLPIIDSLDVEPIDIVKGAYWL